MEIYNDLVLSPEFSGTSISADTIFCGGVNICNDEPCCEPEIYINLEQTIVSPQQTIYVVSNTVIPQTPIHITQSINRTTPPLKIVVVKDRNLYSRVCGGNTMDSKYIECRRCIDNYITNHPEWQIGDITNKVTGCGKCKRK